MTMQPTHHDPTPSIAALRQKGKVTNHPEYKQPDYLKHGDKPSIYALDKSKRVEIGRKYWEQKENWQSMDSVDWRELKSAKDFELGIGQTFYRHGTLSTWTDDQIKTLHKQMQSTLSLAGGGDDDDDDSDSDDDNNNGNGATGLTQSALDTLDKPRHRESKENASVATVVINNDVSISLSADAAAQLNSTIGASSISYSQGGGGSSIGYDNDFVDNITPRAGGNKIKNKKKRKNKTKGGQPTHGPTGTDLALLDIANEIERQKQAQATLGPNYNGNNNKNKDDTKEFDPKDMKGHRRTRTEALRLKLTDMERRLKNVTEDLNKTTKDRDAKTTDLQAAKTQLEIAKEDAQQKDKLKNELAALTGALRSAQGELEEAEAQISRKDQENANLQRELTICKQLNAELFSSKGDEPQGLTPDDLINTRIADAKRFAFMLTAMQEQLEFERAQFIRAIHELENQLEHKDVQLTALYQLYTKLVAKTEKKGWFSRWLDGGSNDKDKDKDAAKIVAPTGNNKQAADV